VSSAIPAPPHEIVFAITSSLVSSRALHLVAELGIADHIADEPVTAATLASRCGVDPGALDRLLRLLAAHGIFEVDGSGYRHTDSSRLLRSDHPMSMRAFARLMNLPACLASFGALDHSLRTGAPAIEMIEPKGFFAYLHAHPAEAQIFGAAMTAKARADIATVLDAYDFRPFRTIADIGGGRGHLLQAVLNAVPNAHGVLFDLPQVIDTPGIASGRLRTHPGDFFADSLPAADAYLLLEVIHDWADTEATAILRAVRRAAAPGAAVLIIEGVAPDDRDDPRVCTLDVIMLALTGGRERTAGQLGELLRSADFRPTGVVETEGPMRIVEGIAV
jgi:C-methyltransferase